MNTNEGNIFPHIIVEGTHKFHDGGGTREHRFPDWDTLEDCEWINPVYITPQSIKLKFASFNQRSQQNMHIRVFGTLFVQTETFIVVDSIKVVK